ncbi:glycosyltransferase family 4 protein [Halobacillus litoralis]|uniref:glycosyltransferase family 4 protein n=1 Tax=Halobacillus litoralis TaxID=45668 RepID=UPI001CFE6024|nr:glycosyltransferase family 4 protein [Halobacillus litoralis]
MKVLMLTDKLLTGGAESYFCKLENSLKHPKLQVYTAAAPGEMFNKLKRKGNYAQISRKNHLNNLLKITRIVVKQKIDLIHANSLKMALIAIFIKKTIRKNIKIVYTKHSLTLLDSKASLFSFLMNKYVDRIIAVSQFEKDRLVSLGVKQQKIEVIYNGVDLKQFHFYEKETEDQFNIGILARLSEEKNHQLFIEIANKLKEIPSVKFHIAGDGPESDRISNMISTLGLTHKVSMLGNVDQPESFIKGMDLLLLTSHLEVFPMVILEAMAVGTPVISINRGGIKEAILDGETGFLITDHSVDDFSSQIMSMHSDSEKTKKIVQAARRKVENEFSDNKMIDRTLSEYLKCM